MLLRFEVGNHRSICEPVELSMVAMDKDRAAARQLEGLDERVLAVAGIYGANGSGKTNLIDALAWLSHAVGVSLRAWEDAIPCDPFSFASGPPQPSYFGIELIVSGVRYRYELEVDESRVVFEALYSHPQQRRRTLFERRWRRSVVQARHAVHRRRARADHADNIGDFRCQPTHRGNRPCGALAARHQLRRTLASSVPRQGRSLVPTKLPVDASRLGRLPG